MIVYNTCVDRSIIRYEIVRHAYDHRRPLWAPVLSSAVRIPGANRDEIELAVKDELIRLVAEGTVCVFRVPRFWGNEQPISGEELERTISDERVWRPRSMSVAKLPRLGLTDAGMERFRSGQFGQPSPIAWIPDWFNLRTPERAEDLNEKQLAFAAAGTLMGCLVYGAIVGTNLIPDLGRFVNKIFPYGTGLLVFSISGLIVGALVGRAFSAKAQAEWTFDPRMPVRAVDELGDARF